MQVIDSAQLELYTNNFGGTKLKRNYIWGYANKRLNTAVLHNHLTDVDEVCITRRPRFNPQEYS
jgi:hypothetical protein